MVARAKKNLKGALIIIDDRTWSKDILLKINERKTKHMKKKNNKRNKSLELIINYSGRRYCFKRVGRFNYLGVKIIGNRVENIEI